MAPTKYGWAAGSAFTRQDAQAIGDRLVKMQGRTPKVLPPERIVREAERPKSPLHDCFQWDDERAAFSYRLEQARSLTNHLVKITIVKGTETLTKAFYNVQVISGDGVAQGYLSADVTLSDDALYKQILNRALQEANAWAKRYADLADLAGIRREIKKAAAKQEPVAA